MSSAPIPEWLRILGWGLLASFVLHWMALDLMRSKAWLPRAEPLPALQVKLRPDDVRMAPEARRSEVTRAEAPKLRAVKASPQSRDVAAQPTAATTATPDETASVVTTPFEGMRSGRPAEAMVALRLALADALAAGPVISLASPGFLMWCDFDATGHLLEVRGEPAVTPALHTWIKRVAGRVAVPESLVGRAFSLDLLVEAD